MIRKDARDPAKTRVSSGGGDEKLILLAILSGGAYFAMLAVAAGLGIGTPVCFLREFTGIPCPGCGGTRALLKLSKGDFIGAVALNPLAVLAAGGAGILGAYCAGVLISYWKPLRTRGLGRRGRAALVALGGILLLANWVYLVATFSKN